jgi:hypothetical protein
MISLYRLYHSFVSTCSAAADDELSDVEMVWQHVLYRVTPLLQESVESVGEHDLETSKRAHDGDSKRPAKRQRVVAENFRFSQRAIALLCDAFDLAPRPSSQDYTDLANRLCVPRMAVRRWFENRRAEYRTDIRSAFRIG